jgi:hypothetical protein
MDLEDQDVELGDAMWSEMVGFCEHGGERSCFAQDFLTG